MTQFLLFRLAAPLASFGAVAVGERRPSWDRPSKSQVLGLVAGALGIERSDEQRQAGLVAGLGFAVRVDQPGYLASDFHTAQSPKQASIKRHAKAFGPIRTRADELACDDVKTILSRREFRVGSLHTLALWRTGEAAPALQVMANALAAPVFAPFAGRKAHPLMLPVLPQVLDAPDVPSAFAAYDIWEEEHYPEAIRLRAARGLEAIQQPQIFADVSAVPEGDRSQHIFRLEERRDLPESRAKWRFGLRTEALLRSTLPQASTQGENP